MASPKPSVLVVVVGTTRAWELSWESLSANLLDELDADLALCVGDRDEGPNPFYERAMQIWRVHEPDDWAEAYDEAVGDSSWRALLEPGDALFGGIRDTPHPQPGMVALLIYMRWFLRGCLEGSGALESYDWLVMTRSDFLWPLPHPDLHTLSDRRLYLLDGEQYGGVSCRHVVLPRRLAGRFLQLYDPVFEDPERLALQLERWRYVAGWSFLNLERFQAARLDDLGLRRRIGYLPYVPYAVRAPGGPTGWSTGVLDPDRGFYVKYPSERERSELTRHFIGDQRSWRKYLAPIRGAPARRRLRRSYRRRGLYERPFLLRDAHRRAYRRTRWAVLHLAELRKRAEVPIGRGLRRVPGMQPVLDARLRRRKQRSP
jgi:hypothetical protein